MKQISFRFIRWTGHGPFLLVLKGGAFSEVDTGVLRGLPYCFSAVSRTPLKGAPVSAVSVPQGRRGDIRGQHSCGSNWAAALGQHWRLGFNRSLSVEALLVLQSFFTTLSNLCCVLSGKWISL